MQGVSHQFTPRANTPDRAGDPADHARIPMGEGEPARQRGARRHPQAWPRVPDLSRQRDRCQLQPRHAERGGFRRPARPAAWTKSPQPVFRSSGKAGQYGPGHHSFTTTPDGKRDILMYHARSYREIKGDPLHDPNRHTRA